MARDTRYLKFLTECAKRAGLVYPKEFAAQLKPRVKFKDGRHLSKILAGDLMPTRQLLEEAAQLAGFHLNACLNLPTDHPGMLPIEPEKEPYYLLLTGIYRNKEKYWIESIEGNLYAMYIAGAEDRKMPAGVPEPPVNGSLRRGRKRGKPPPGQVLK